MNIYTAIADLLFAFPLVQSWPEMKSLLQRAISAEPCDWQLPVAACQAVGGTAAQAIPAAAAIACLQISIVLIDDMLDDDPRGEYHRIGAAAAANMAAAFQALSLDVIAQCQSLAPHAKLSILQHLNQMALTIACGQYLDAQNPMDEASYWRLVQTKSAPFFGVALQIGALTGLAATETQTAVQMRQLGELYGEMIQIHDDLGDAMAQPANSDWLLGRSPLPILFAKTVPHPQQDQFLALCNAITHPGALAEAQTILIRCGAVSYCLDQLASRYEVAKDLLAQMSLAYEAGLTELLNLVFRPVQKLLQTVETPREWAADAKAAV